jgi:hypothetical protein
MIYLHQARLVILSQPKTGTTALDNALFGRASMAISNPPAFKHMQYHKFMKFVAPMLKAQANLDRSDYEVVSVMREPVDWLGSWYRYRTRDALKDGNKKQRGNYTGNVSFETFVQEVLKPKTERQSFAQIGSPCGVALKGNGGIGCDRIFPYENLSGLYALIEERTKKPLDIAKMNVSPQGDISLSEETHAALKAEWAHAFDLHGSLVAEGTIAERFRVAGGDGEGDEDAVVA